jgi:hypothetical protein
MTTRDRIVIIIVLAVGAVVAGWMLVVSPKRQEAASLSTQISTVQSTLDTARGQVNAGQVARTAFAGQYAQLAKLGEAVPPNDDIPSLIYQVQSAAQAAHVSFRGLQLTAGGAATAAPSSSSTPNSSSSAGAGSSTSALSASQLPPGAALGPAGLPTEQFTFTLGGDFFRMANFFKRLESFVISRDNRLLISGRLMTINGINLSPGSAGFPQITASISATTYIVPATQGPLGGAAPGGPAAAPLAQASTSGSSTAAPAAAITPVLR